MKILILIGIRITINLLMVSLLHYGKVRQRKLEDAEKIRFRLASITDKESQWRVR
jgi:hypothetical protein